MPVASAEMHRYFADIEAQFAVQWEIASRAREKGLDPSSSVETKPTKDIASRVEGLVGPKGIADRIKLLPKELSREEGVVRIAREIVEEKAFHPETASGELQRKEKLLEQAVRTGLAFFTEGVVSAPIEGISKVRIKQNPDQTHYVALYFSGPIRGAGGTGQAFTVLIADYLRRLMGIGEYRPTESEMERTVEESNLYAAKTRAGQYVPTEEEVRHIVANCKVCITGDPTEDYEANVYKDVYNVETNRVRGGMCLVLSEGICLKAAKVLKLSRKLGIDWDWLERLIKVSKKSAEKMEIKPVEKYMEEIVAGRPIFSFPMRAGGFRLRYGRTMYTGIASKAIHPATMRVLDDFVAFGTQMKIERPGKGCIATPCDSIDGPIVKLKSGEVRQLSDEAEAAALSTQIEKVLFLGDLLVCYGDFLKANSPLVPSAWCDEWYSQELEAAGIRKNAGELGKMGADEAFSLATQKKGAVSLAPKYTYFWHDLAPLQVKELAYWLAKGKLAVEWFDVKAYSVQNSGEKSLLERLGVPHSLEDGNVKMGREHALALLKTLNLLKDKAITTEKFDASFDAGLDVMELVEKLSGIKIRRKAGIYVGASMGRPEKSKERKMKPPVHSLFPIGEHGGKMRDLVKAASIVRDKFAGKIEVEASISLCPICGRKTLARKCPDCGERTETRRQCSNQQCNRMASEEEMACRKCGSPTKAHEKQVMDFHSEFEAAQKRAGHKPEQVKAVRGLISATKRPEAIEKGILRSKHSLSVFRDGTCRFDATEIPATHFRPSEIGLTVEDAKKLGYEKDKDGNPLTTAGQVVELRAQDVIISDYAAQYLLRVTKFIDDLLVYHYDLPEFYKCGKASDLVGKLVVAIAPHTSAGILARIIGISGVRGIIAHPFLHCACRRNADGDELCLMLLLDNLLNFSTYFLPESRGGKMDATLVLTTILDPNEIDDEAHAMDAVDKYPLDFYEATLRIASPAEADIGTVRDRLNSEAQYEGLKYTHDARIAGPLSSKYVEIANMREKVNEELGLMGRLVAVDSQVAAERIILSHFFPDLYGNLRKFSKQKFRCVDCNAIFRRVPLKGKCNRCGGKLVLTVSKGSINKYLEISKELAEKYDLPLYLKQRLLLIEKEIASVFAEEKQKQFSLADYA